MFGTTYGHGLIRKYVIFFGTLFNNLYLNRYDNDGTLIQNAKVPLNYGPREKYLARVDGNRDGVREIAIQLPRMSFEVTNVYYDYERAIPRLNKFRSNTSDVNGDYPYQYAPVPYNIDFTLSILTKSEEDGTFILEQILPYFAPDFTATLLLNPEIGDKYDVPLSINSITHEDTYEGDFINRRAVIWELTFTMKGWFFGPTRSGDAKIIKEIDVNLAIPGLPITVDTANPTNTDPNINIQITPGQDANGAAVAWYGDATANTRPTSVAANTINQEEQWGFMIDFTEDL